MANDAPAMPSSRQWWYFISRATRPPTSPSRNHSSQSGQLRSSWVERRPPATSATSRAPPGLGTPMRWMCRRTSKSVSSTHIGRSSPKGTSRIFHRNFGAQSSRPSMRSTTSSKVIGRSPGSRTVKPPTCWCQAGVSIDRNTASLPRSLLMFFLLRRAWSVRVRPGPGRRGPAHPATRHGPGGRPGTR